MRLENCKSEEYPRLGLEVQSGDCGGSSEHHHVLGSSAGAVTKQMLCVPKKQLEKL